MQNRDSVKRHEFLKICTEVKIFCIHITQIATHIDKSVAAAVLLSIIILMYSEKVQVS